jgi:hypothetical protein
MSLSLSGPQTDQHALRALLLAHDSGPRRIRPPRAGGGWCGLCRRPRARQRRRCAGDDEVPRRHAHRASAVRAAVSQGRQSPGRADCEHPALPRRARRIGRPVRTQTGFGFISCSSPSPISSSRSTTLITRSRQIATTRTSAAKPSSEWVKRRPPKFLGYFEGVLRRSGGPYLLGRRPTYADLSLFQIVAGLCYAFPKAMGRQNKKAPRVVALHDRVALRPRIAAYLASERRISFNEQGIFRRYPELDG